MPRPLPIVAIGSLGALLFWVAGALGAGRVGSEELRPHLIVGLLAVLAWLFSQSWIALYVWTVHRPALERGGEPAAWSRLRLEGWAWPVLATALVVATFATGAPAFTRAVPAATHLGLAIAAAAAQALALWREAVVLSRQRRLLLALEASPPA